MEKVPSLKRCHRVGSDFSQAGLSDGLAPLGEPVLLSVSPHDA